MALYFNGSRRADYCRKHRLFGAIGDNVMIQIRTLPLYADKIYIGNNVRIASEVLFVTHDVVHHMLNNMNDNPTHIVFKEKIGSIEIGNNVFIGSRSVLLYDTKVGNNVIIAAGSVVTKNVENDSVVGGVPARKISTFSDFLDKRINGQLS